MDEFKSGSIEQFKGYSQFATLKEFNAHMEMWLAVQKKEFTKGELVGLMRLVRFAAKIPGVSNAKIGTILKAIHEEYDGNGMVAAGESLASRRPNDIGVVRIEESQQNLAEVSAGFQAGKNRVIPTLGMALFFYRSANH